MQPTGKNHTNRAAVRTRRDVLARTSVGVLTGVLGTVLVGGRAMAHEGDYYPDETIPEKARSIIEESTNGGSANLIYAGIAGLLVTGVTVYLANAMRNRRDTTAASGGESVGPYTSTADGERTGGDTSGDTGGDPSGN